MRFVGLIVSLCAVLFGSSLFGDEAPQKQKPLPVAEFYKNFEQVPIDKDTGALFGPRVYLGTAGTPERYNSLTLVWGATGVLWSRPSAIVYIRENRYSFRFSRKTPYSSFPGIPSSTCRRFTGSSGASPGAIRTRKYFPGSLQSSASSGAA